MGSDAGNVALAVLEVVSTSGSHLNFGVRKNGSTDTLLSNIRGGNHIWIAIGVDSGDIFECNVANITDIDVYLVAYATEDEASNLTNAVDKSLGTAGSWLDIDISGDTGADTAVAAFFKVDNNIASARFYGLRENGSTDSRLADVMANALHGGFMSVDGSEILEGHIEDLNVDFYLVGWLISNFTSFANAKDYSTGTTNSWVDADMSADIPSGNDGAFMEFFRGTSGAPSGGIRKNGETYDNKHTMQRRAFLWTELDAGRIAEQNVSTTNLDLFLWGYTAQPVAGAALVQTVSETVQVSEALSRRLAMVRALDETVEVSEVASALRGLVRLVGEALDLSEGIVTQLGTQIVKVVSESVEVAEAVLALVAAAPRGAGPHIEHGTSFPANPTEHDLFFRDDEQKLYIRNSGNTAWLLLGPEV